MRKREIICDVKNTYTYIKHSNFPSLVLYLLSFTFSFNCMSRSVSFFRKYKTHFVFGACCWLFFHTFIFHTVADVTAATAVAHIILLVIKAISLLVFVCVRVCEVLNAIVRETFGKNYKKEIDRKQINYCSDKSRAF